MRRLAQHWHWHQRRGAAGGGRRAGLVTAGRGGPSLPSPPAPPPPSYPAPCPPTNQGRCQATAALRHRLRPPPPPLRNPWTVQELPLRDQPEAASALRHCSETSLHITPFRCPQAGPHPAWMYSDMLDNLRIPPDEVPHSRNNYMSWKLPEHVLFWAQTSPNTSN